MKKIIISVLLIAISIGGVGINQITKKSDEVKNDTTTEKISNVEESSVKETEINDSVETDTDEVTDKNQGESSDTKSQNKTNNSKSKPKQEITESTAKVEEQQVVQETPKQEQPVKQETPQQEQPKQEQQKPSYIGVPDPNDLDYPVHHGVIQYKTYEECYNAGIELSFSDSSVKSFWSYPVRDSRASILGYYLYVERY